MSCDVCDVPVAWPDAEARVRCACGHAAELANERGLSNNMRA